jgi:hypothetical protein
MPALTIRIGGAGKRAKTVLLFLWLALTIAWRRYLTRPTLGAGKNAVARLIPYAAERNLPPTSSELIVPGFALITLLIAQWLLSTAVHGANYYGFDGKMAQATILAALKFGGLFDVTNISPIEGVGSQMMTINVWANPSVWPFAFFDKEFATDLSALVALGIFATACYIMTRCFDVPIVPSAIAAQLCILLFAPALLILKMPTNFCLTPANAIVYAPHMIALGLLARIEPGPWRRFALITVGIFVMLFFSLCADPLWTMVNGFSWVVAFAVVTIGSFRVKTIVLRAASLSCCVLLLVITGAASYLYTISQYTSRVQFPELVDRPRSLALATTLAYSPNMKTFYLTCALGWLLGLVMSRGRLRLLAAAAAASFGAYVVYSVIYLLLLNAVWVPPIPTYLEQSLWVLYVAGAVAGYWSALQTAASFAERLAAAVSRRSANTPIVTGPGSSGSRLFGILGAPKGLLQQSVAFVIALILVAIIPVRVADYAFNSSGPHAEIYHLPWSNEPELMQFLSENVSSRVDEPLRGSIAFWDINADTTPTISQVWAHGMHTIDEYSQLVTPQAVYFLYAVLKQREVLGSLNGFVPYPGLSWDTFGNVMQLFGMRYYLTSYGRAAAADQAGYPLITLPRRPEPGLWYVYEYPRPNVGDYSPTEIVTARTAAEVSAKISAPDFNFTRQAVLFTPVAESLVPARDMLLSRIRGGLHVSGKSSGTSLVVLPQQFSHCLRARDSRVRFVRANLLMAGMIFSGELDTDIVFDYGIFSPGCRGLDLADMKQLDLRIDLRMPHLTGDRIFPDWDGAASKLRAAWKSMALLYQSTSPSPEESAEASNPPETDQLNLQRFGQRSWPIRTASGFVWFPSAGPMD